LATVGAEATNTLAGRFSRNPNPVCAGLPAPFVMVKVMVDVPPRPMTVGENALVSAVPTTCSVAFTPAAVRPPVRPLMLAALLT
jgi:hypothetical protein